MTLFSSYAGRRIVSGIVSIPYYGAWAADMVLAEGDAVATGGDLVIGPLTLARAGLGRSGSLGGSRGIALFGGPGWRTEVPALGYSNAAGVRLATVLGDVSATVGETLVGVDSSATVGLHYMRRQGRAERVLRALAGDLWWVRPDGVTSLEARASTAIVTPFLVESRDGANGRVRVSTESPGDWMPGRTFASATLPEVQTIAHTQITLSAAGEMRVEVMVT